MESGLEEKNVLEKLCDTIREAKDVIYLGRGTSFPIALEGALKLKEISYIHAEGYPSGELKHGPIALIDKNMPVVVLAPFDEWFFKTLSNIQEVLARGAYVIALTDEKGKKSFEEIGHENLVTVTLPTCSTFSSPIVFSTSIQLLAYYTACLKGTDVDQPRNLAKSVTVE